MKNEFKHTEGRSV